MAKWTCFSLEYRCDEAREIPSSVPSWLLSVRASPPVAAGSGSSTFKIHLSDAGVPKGVVSCALRGAWPLTGGYLQQTLTCTGDGDLHIQLDTVLGSKAHGAVTIGALSFEIESSWHEESPDRPKVYLFVRPAGPVAAVVTTTRGGSLWVPRCEERDAFVLWGTVVYLAASSMDRTFRVSCWTGRQL